MFFSLPQRKGLVFLPYLLITLGMVVGFFFFSQVRTTKSTADAHVDLTLLSKKTPREQAAYLGDSIRAYGAGTVYQELKAATTAGTVGASHGIAHAFGEALYAEVGTEGIGICDDAFEFGCYHGFFGRAVSTEGPSVMQKLNAACRSTWGARYLPCHHGIGHGVIASVGVNRLVDALRLCATISSEPIGGCASGVIMGYNFRNLNHSDTIETRPIERNDPQLPCVAAPREFLPACYAEQPQWWLAVLGNDFKKIGILCAKAPDEASDACFHGIGNFAAPALQFDVERAKAACSDMPTRDSQVQCREGASWIFLAQSATRDRAPLLCQGLEPDAETVCMQKITSNPFWQK